MRFLKYLSLLFTALFIITVPGSAQDIVNWTVTGHQNADGTATVRFTADIAPGWHMYDMQKYDLGPNPTQIVIVSHTGMDLVGGIAEVTQPNRKYDELFDAEIGYYQVRAVFEQIVRLTAPTGRIRGSIEWMVCNDTACLPPDEIEFSLDLKGGPEPIAADLSDGITAIDEESPGEEEVPVVPLPEDPGEYFDASADPLAGSIWRMILAAMKWALLAIVTPCVFPMIPMTVSFFMKEGTSKAAGRFRAFMYGLFIVAIYTIPIAAIILITRFVGGETVTSDIFNWLSTHWLPNILFFLIFMFFAASFFGAFELNLPSWMVTKSDSKSEKGGLAGVFFMALTLVLVSFSCTVPIVGSALTEATVGGNWQRPIIAILSYSVVFALPFTLFAFFPAWLTKLPKSGGWLNSVKVVLGFVEVALGLKFLSVADQTYHWGILDREIYLAIWIVVFSLMGAYLLGKIRFKYDSDVKYIGVGRLALVIATFTFVVYLIPGMFGAPLKGISGYLPPLYTQDFIAGGQAVRSGGEESTEDLAPLYGDFLHLPLGLDGFFDLDQAQEYADRVGKPLFVDVTGHGCVNCREMEARVWSDARVLQLLRNEFVIVALYVDDKINVPRERWVTTANGRTLKSLGKINAYRAMQLYGNNSQPMYVIQGRGGKILAGPKGYDLNVDNFVNFLKEGRERYR